MLIRCAQANTNFATAPSHKFKGKKAEVSRFKGLGEMNPAQLKEQRFAFIQSRASALDDEELDA